MYSLFHLIGATVISASLVCPVIADENVNLQSYTCADFLKDAKAPADGVRLLRSLMMVSWAAGYAAAYQKGSPRADPTAVRVISAALGNACRQVPTQTAVQAIASVITRFANGEPAAAKTATPELSLWDQNGSIVSLASDGATRRFSYEIPRAELVPAGVQKGTLLFDGKKNGNKYVGNAYVLANSCPPVSYQVTGDITNDEKQITLKGRAPEISSGCKPVRYHDEFLVLKFIPADQR